MWLNAFIIYQIHTMLLKAQRCERTSPPTTKQVICQVSVIFSFAGMWAAWSLVLLLQGSNIFDNINAAWLTSKAVMCGPPFLYTIGVCLHVWWKNLLPPTGRTRILSLYFLRVVLVFLLTWVPFLILVDVAYYKTASLWMLGLAYLAALKCNLSFKGSGKVSLCELGKSPAGDLGKANKPAVIPDCGPAVEACAESISEP